MTPPWDRGIGEDVNEGSRIDDRADVVGMIVSSSSSSDVVVPMVVSRTFPNLGLKNQRA